MLIKPGEEFSVENVIEKALRQDIGPDPTLAMNTQDYKYVDEKNPAFPIWEYKKKYRDRDPVISAESYFYDYNQIERRQRQFDFDQEKPATFINRPLSRAQIRRKFMRKIRKEDINWKDTAFLTKFMNETGKIINKYQSRLPTGVHRKVAKTIKKVRDLEIFAHVGLLKPTDKIPVGSFVEDLEEMHKKTIDPVTGRLFLKHSIQDTLKEKEERIFTRLEERLEGSESNAEFATQADAGLKERILREMSLESAGGRLVPDRVQRQWMIAQSHIIERDGKLEEQEEQAKLSGKEYQKPEVEYLGAKEAYEEVTGKISADSPSPNRLFDQFISEKSLNVHKIHSAKKVTEGADAAVQLKESISNVKIDE
jgi:ribosomal protein S18